MTLITNMTVGHIATIPFFSNTFNEGVVATKNMFVEISSQYNDDHDVVFT